MSMLHALAAEKSEREIWWIYGTRDSSDHPFAEESRVLLKQLARGRGYIVYSRPAASDKAAVDFDAPGHIDTALLGKIGVSKGSDFYLCAPLHSCRTCAMGCKTGVRSPGMCTRKSSVHWRALHRAWRKLFTPRTCRHGRPDLVRQSRSRAAGLPPLGMRNSRACLNWRKRAMFRSDGRAGPESAIPA